MWTDHALADESSLNFYNCPTVQTAKTDGLSRRFCVPLRLEHLPFLFVADWDVLRGFDTDRHLIRSATAYFQDGDINRRHAIVDHDPLTALA